MQILVPGAGRLERQRGLQPVLVAHDLHRAVLLDPQLADDYVVHAAVDVVPRVRLAVARQLHRDRALGLDLDAFAPELELRVDRPVEGEPVRAVRVERRYRRVVGDLQKLDDNMYVVKIIPTFVKFN